MGKINNREVAAFELGYYVDNHGNIYDSNHKALNGYMGTNGYFFIRIKINREKIPIYFHRLVALFKYGAILYKEGYEVRHLNGNKKDNSFDNIKMGTHRENMLDVPIEDRIKSASKHKKYDKLLIKDFLLKTKNVNQTLSYFNINDVITLKRILRQYSLEIGELLYISSKFKRKYDYKEIYEFYNTNKSYKKTIDKFNISRGTLHFILKKI